MKKAVLLCAILGAFAAQNVQAAKGDIVVRLRATNISPDESSKLGETTDAAYGAGTAAALYGNATANLEVDTQTIPELDLSYYITDNIALELILALGSKHKVNVDSGTGAVNPKLGTVNALPPTLTAQWHFRPDQRFDPYVGAGVSYVRFMDNGLSAQAGASSFPIRVDRSNWGGALQAGLDFNMDGGWLLNFDVKKIWVDTDVKLNLGTGYRKIDSLDIDPWVISFGFGKKF